MPRRAAPERTVFLVGFMASGKSASGKELSRLLGLPFVDTDREIERAAGMSVPDLFARRGEKAFRALEAKAVARAARGKAAVVALGGGAVLDARSVALLRARGVVVHLRAPFSRLWARAWAAGLRKRPLLAAEDDDASRARMKELFEVRRPLYRKAAHLVVNADGPAKLVAARLARRLAREAR